MFKELDRQFAPSERLGFEVRSSKMRTRKTAYQAPLEDYGKVSPMVRP